MKKNKSKNKIKEREIWLDMYRNPFDYVHSIRYVMIAILCAGFIVLIHVACTSNK